MINLDLPGNMFNFFKKKVIALYVLFMFMSVAFGCLSTSAVFSNTDNHVGDNVVSIDNEFIGDKKDLVLTKELSVKERMLERVNTTDVLQVFTNNQASDKPKIEIVLPQYYSIPSQQKIDQQPEYEIVANSAGRFIVKNRMRKKGRRINIISCGPEASAKIAFDIIIIIFTSHMLYSAISVIYNKYFKIEKIERKKYDENGNKYRGLALQWSFDEYKARRRASWEKFFSTPEPKNCPKVYSAASRRPLDSDFALYTPPIYSGTRRDSTGYGGYSGGYGTPKFAFGNSSPGLGARPSPLIRRSSFPSTPQYGVKPAAPSLRQYGFYKPGYCGGYTGDSGDSTPEFFQKKRIRLLRRH